MKSNINFIFILSYFTKVVQSLGKKISIPFQFPPKKDHQGHLLRGEKGALLSLQKRG